MKKNVELIVCDICEKEIDRVAGTSMHCPLFVPGVVVQDGTSADVYYKEICYRCSDEIISAIECRRPDGESWLR